MFFVNDAHNGFVFEVIQCESESCFDQLHPITFLYLAVASGW